MFVTQKLLTHFLGEVKEVKLVFWAWLIYATLRKIKTENQKVKNEKWKMKNEKRKVKSEKWKMKNKKQNVKNGNRNKKVI